MTSASQTVLGIAGFSTVAKGCDDALDTMQKRFSGQFAAALLSANPDEQAAADRLHTASLEGEGRPGHSRRSLKRETRQRADLRDMISSHRR